MSEVDGSSGIGKIWVGNGRTNQYVDMLHMYTVCVRNCDDEGNCDYSSSVEEFHYPKWFGPRVNNRVVYQIQQCELDKGSGELGVISNYVAVLNAGKSDELIMTSSTYRGLKNRNQALLVYQKYLAAPLQNH